MKNSVQGYVSFNAPTIYQGTPFDNIRLEFKDGKIVNATGSNPRRLNEILDSDDGARFIGEFSLAFNPHILEPMRDILFDEKISGSFHFTPARPTSRRTMATARRSTGISSISSAPSTAAAPSISMAN